MNQTFKIEEENVKCNLCHADDTRFLFSGKDRQHSKEGLFRVVQCKICGLVYLNPRPTQRNIGYYYPSEYIPYGKTAFQDIGIMGKGRGSFARLKNWMKKTILEEHYKYDFRNFGKTKKKKNLFKKVLTYAFLPKYRKMYYQTIPCSENGKVLDIGCGSGSYLAWLKQLGWQAYGVEMNKDCVEFAAKEYGIDIFCGDLLEAKFPDSYFDCVTMWSFLEHCRSPLETLKETNRILKQGGLMVIFVPNFDSLEIRVLREKSFLTDIPRHLYNFSPRTLQAMLIKAGFKVKKVVYFPRIDMLRWSLNVFLEEKGSGIRLGGRWLSNPLVKLAAGLLSLCRLASIMTFYVEKTTRKSLRNNL